MVEKLKSILVVDDSQAILDLLGSILEGEGYRDILFATSAEDAFKILGLNSRDKNYLDVDIILMDIVMPGMDGIEACRCIKAQEYFKDVPIVMVTKRTEMDVLQKAFDAGAIDYIVKPANEAEFLSRVRSFLKLKHAMDERKMREEELLKVTNKLKQANENLQRLSYLDGLTGIGNRRYFDELYDKEWRQARRASVNISLLMIDIDYFKAFNDLYGHQSGDDCLRDVAQSISDSLRRPVDFVARYGGEEFAVILPQTDIMGAEVVAANIIKDISVLAITHGGSMVNNLVTVSIGAASIVPHRDEDSSRLLVRLADEALYKAKNDGRNRIVVVGR
ncbi:MAG: diguanylate cyclase [Proteobacteria bacterium]|nr:diguanylate cyclase [Pseudomonadota bacterium]MBU1715609.1 diguanylate cyclase [Pseudomonadota bacterium]